jgi:protoheme IX farnesyltransferase
MTQLTRQNDATLELDALAAAPRSAGRVALSDWNQLTKPRITALVVVTAYIGYVVGTRELPGSFSWLVLMATLAGTALSCAGACIFNQVLERDVDALMKRTENRPLPAGRVSMLTAVLAGVIVSGVGLALLLGFSTPLAAAVSAFTILSYALVYTPLKRITSTCTIVGAVPGALPPVIGYAAATGRFGVEAWAMFAILFLWQLPHFLAIAWLYKDDYAKAGMPMLPVVDDAHYSATCRQTLLGCLALLPLGLLPTAVGMAGMVYFVGAFLAGLAFLAFGVALVIKRTRRHARALFFASLVYLPLVYLLMLIDRT